MGIKEVPLGCNKKEIYITNSELLEFGQWASNRGNRPELVRIYPCESGSITKNIDVSKNSMIPYPAFYSDRQSSYGTIPNETENSSKSFCQANARAWDRELRFNSTA